MSRKWSRREFVRAGAASAGALAAGVSCKNKRAPEKPAAVPTAVSNPSASRAKPPQNPLVERLSRKTFLDLLDATADMKMRLCHNCAQATFAALAEVFELDSEPTLKALTPLPGVAERGETCGAIIASLLVIGMFFGRDRLEDWAGWRACLVPARAFCDRFERELGATRCGDLQEKFFGRRFNLADPEELKAFQAAVPGPVEVCGKIVRAGARLAAEVILNRFEAASKKPA